MNWEHERKLITAQLYSGVYDFNELAIKLFHLQARFNVVYGAYLRALGKNCNSINSIEEIPFLPISLFKNYRIATGEFETAKEFYSSGTTQANRSIHPIRDLELYKYISSACFKNIFDVGVGEFIHLGLLPSYADNAHSSLLFMLDHFISQGGGGYYHNDSRALCEKIVELKDRKVIVWGVSYALYKWHLKLPYLEHLCIIETGGMKGMGKEMIRAELHDQIKSNFNTTWIGSEYGMTELLSQSYSLPGQAFRPPSTLQVMNRSISDPFEYELIGNTGVLNIIDLANIDSCAFIATDDLGKVYSNGQFEVLGRLDHSDTRGCNLLVT